MAEARLKARAEMNTTEFDRGLAKMKQGVQTFTTRHLKQLGGAIAATFAASKIYEFGKEALVASDNIMDLSQKLKLLPEDLQALQVLAEQNGGSIDGMNSALSRLQAQMNAVAYGSPKAVKAMKELGIDADFVAEHQNDMGMIFEEVAAIITQSNGDMKKSAAGKFFLGDAFQELNATMGELAFRGLPAVKKGLLDLNQISSNKVIAELDASWEKWKAIGREKSVLGRIAESWVVPSAKTPQLRQQSAEQIAKNKQAIRDALDAEEAKKREKIDKIMNAPMPDLNIAPPQAADQYARIGGFSGGQVFNGPRMIMERQLRVAEEMEKRLKKVEELMKETRDAARDTADNTED